MPPKSKTAGQHPAVLPQWYFDVFEQAHYSMSFLCLSRKVHSHKNRSLPC